MKNYQQHMIRFETGGGRGLVVTSSLVGFLFYGGFMAENANYSNSTPINGAQPNNRSNEQSATYGQHPEEKKQAKRVSPKKLFAEYYGTPIALNPRLAHMKIGKASSEIPTALIAYNRKRMNDEDKRIKRLKGEIGAYRYALQTRSIPQDNGKRLMIDEFTFKRMKVQKVHLQAELLEAKLAFETYRELVENAEEAAMMRDLEFIKRSKEQASIQRTAPSIAAKWTALVKANGSLVPMKETALVGSQKDFREKFMEFVATHQDKDDKRIAEKPKLFTRVMELVMANLVDEAKNDTSATPAEDATDHTSNV
jgi:hypothetical protein